MRCRGFTFDKLNTARVTGPDCKATEMLRQYYNGKQATLAIDATMPNNGGYRINGGKDNITLGTVLNNVNASPKMLTPEYINKFFRIICTSVYQHDTDVQMV